MQKTLKVIHFHPVAKYAERFVYPLLISFENPDFRVESSCVCCDHDGDTRKSFQSVSFSIKRVKDITTFFAGLKKVHALLKEIKPDVVISHNSIDAIFPLIIARLLRVKTRVYFNHGWPADGYSSLVKYFLVLGETLCGLFSSEIITVSPYLKKKFKSLGFYQVSIIDKGTACGVEMRLSMSKIRYIRTKNRLRQGFQIGFVGRPVARKGFEVAIVAFKSALESCPGSRLVVAGIQETEVPEQFRGLPGVEWKGFISNNELESFYIESDVILAPSFHEGLSYTVLEAMSYGCFVIGRDIPGISCLLDGNLDFGLLVPAESGPDSFSDAIISAYRQRLGDDWVLNQSDAYFRASNFERKAFLHKYFEWVISRPN